MIKSMTIEMHFVINRELLKESVSRLEMELIESNHKLELMVATNNSEAANLKLELSEAEKNFEAANLKWELKEAKNVTTLLQRTPL